MMCRRILENLTELTELVKSVKSTNRLQIAVSLYLECDFIILAMRSVAIFTNKIILPYLNMVSQSNQLIYSTNIKKMFDGLSCKDLDVLADFSEPFQKHSLPIESDLEQQLLDVFSYKCAVVLKR